MNVLYVTQTGLSEPLGQSQVLPYVERLARAGVRFQLLSFEPREAVRAGLPISIRERLEAARVTHIWLRRHSSSSFAVKLFEVAEAVAVLRRRAGLRDLDVIHARSYFPAAIGDALRISVPRAHLLFDMRGFLPDEYADCGYWSRKGAKYRLVKRLERHLLARADLVAVLTHAGANELRKRPELRARPEAVGVVPCAVDTERFSPDALRRQEARARLGLTDQTVMVYGGSLGADYDAAAMARFARLAANRFGRFYFLILTRSSPALVERHVRAEGISDADFRILAVEHAEMPDLVRAADFGIALVRPTYSRVAMSPTKLAEYLSCGLPAVVNIGIGDNRALADTEPGVLALQAFRDPDMVAVLDRLASLLAQPEETGRVCRAAALRHFDVEAGTRKYLAFYDWLMGSRPSRVAA